MCLPTRRITYFLLKNLKETRGNINFLDLSEKISQQVSNIALDKNNKVQTPRIQFPATLGDAWKTMTLVK